MTVRIGIYKEIIYQNLKWADLLNSLFSLFSSLHLFFKFLQYPVSILHCKSNFAPHTTNFIDQNNKFISIPAKYLKWQKQKMWPNSHKDSLLFQELLLRILIHLFHANSLHKVYP